jgi:hypothetical protein
MNLMFVARNWLTEFVQETLNGVVPGFNVANRLRRATWDAKTRRQRLAIMGDPTKYAEVLYAGEDSTLAQEDAVGNHTLSAHIFRVNVWYAYVDSEDYSLSSQYTWDNLIEGENGLLTQLRLVDSFSADQDFFQVYNPENVDVFEVSMDNEGVELSHFLSFTIVIRS